MRKKIKNFSLTDHIRNYFSLTPFERIIPWAEKNIDFSEEISAERAKLDFDQYPYQKPILEQWQNDKQAIKTITVVAPEQTGKTNMFVVGLLYKMIYSPCQSLIVYPSDNLAIETNQTKLLPLMRHIPVLKQELERKRSYRGDCYKFSNLISYFQGAGSKIVSKSCKIVIGDEVDAWPVIGTLDNVADLKKRTRSYNSSICFLISTPTEVNGRIWQSFLKGSQGYWYLRCKNCGELTMRSCDTNNLQFESDYNEELKERIVRTDSIRLICPQCKHEHVEADKVWCNQHGGFIHLIPERLETAPSFQLGALASQLPSLSWTVIANAQLEAGKRNDLKNQITFDNSIRGLPYKPRKIEKEDIVKIREHEWSVAEAPKQDQIEAVYMVADTQDDRSVVGVFAIDVNDNIYLLKAAEPEYLTLDEEERAKINQANKRECELLGHEFNPVETVEDILNADYLVENGVGIKPLFGVIDERGHRMKDIQHFVATHNCIGWLGSKLQSEIYRQSDNIPKAFLANAKHYQCEAIWYLYTQKKRNNEYLFFYPDIEERVIEQITAVRPDPNTNFGHMPEKWTPENRVHDWFDVIKMAYFMRDWLMNPHHMSSKRFRYCKSPRLLKTYQKPPSKPIEHTVKVEEKQWFEGLL